MEKTSMLHGKLHQDHLYPTIPLLHDSLYMYVGAFFFMTDLFNEVHTRNTYIPPGNSLLTRKITKKRPN